MEKLKKQYEELLKFENDVKDFVLSAISYQSSDSDYLKEWRKKTRTELEFWKKEFHKKHHYELLAMVNMYEINTSPIKEEEKELLRIYYNKNLITSHNIDTWLTIVQYVLDDFYTYID